MQQPAIEEQDLGSPSMRRRKPRATAEEQEPLIAQGGGTLQISVEQRPFMKRWRLLASMLGRHEATAPEVRVDVSPAGTGAAEVAPRRALAPLRGWAGAQAQWLGPVLQGCIAWHLAAQCWRLLADGHALCRGRDWQSLFRSRTFHYFLKYWAANAAVLAVVFVLQAHVRNVAAWHPIFVVVTFCVICCEKVDVTLNKGVLRMSGCVVGGVFGYLVMLSPRLASNPWGLAALLAAWSAACGAFVHSRLKYAAFLSLYTASVMILAQYTGEAGSHGSVQFLYSRIADIAIGVALCVVLSCVQPWYLHSAVLESLGCAAAAAGELNAQYFDIMYEELEMAAAPPGGTSDGKAGGDGGAVLKRGVQALEHDVLSRGVAAPIAAAQAALAREAVAWRRGPLALQPLVPDALAALQGLLVRLAALHAVVAQAPIVSGRYSAAALAHAAGPLREVTRASMFTSADVLRAAAAVLAATEDAHALSERLPALEQSIGACFDARVAFRAKYWAVRADHHAAAKTAQNSPWLTERTLDDAVRYLGFVYASGKTCDHALLLARAVLQDERLQQRAARRPRWWRRLVQL